MRNKEIKAVVFETKDYGQFKKVKGNRDVNPNHVNKLKRAIAEKKLDVPILINKADNAVMDGQHRLEAYKELGLPIKFMYANFNDHLDVARLNAHQKKWSFDDYCDFHARRGKQDYGIARHISEKYEVNIESAVLMLLNKASRYINMTEDFQVGNFKIPTGHLEKAHELGARMLTARQYVPQYKRAFISAFIMLNRHPDFNWDRFKTALKANGLKLAGATNRDSYLNWFEHIYNSGLAKGRAKYKKLKLVQWVKDRGYNDVDQENEE